MQGSVSTDHTQYSYRSTSTERTSQSCSGCSIVDVGYHNDHGGYHNDDAIPMAYLGPGFTVQPTQAVAYQEQDTAGCPTGNESYRLANLDLGCGFF